MPDGASDRRDAALPPPAGGAPRAGDRAGFPVVGIGASAGGLEAATELVAALPADGGMAYVLVQHLDPDHDSLMVPLLATHTRLAVREAAEGMAVERDHVYVIPPDAYLAVADATLRLTPPAAPHGARFPIDFLLRSLAEQHGARAIGVVLSGTGTDGTLGLAAIRERGGLTLAQDPSEADQDGMPRSAVAAGVVDLVLPARDIAAALVAHHRTPEPDPGAAPDAVPDAAHAQQGAPAQEGRPAQEGPGALEAILALVRARSVHDFTHYKPGTLQRRIERRMAMRSIPPADMGRYLAVLARDDAELDHLARDLLINVTRFFRDPEVFELLAATIIPDLLREQPADRPLRIWVAGCSTGEEAYSLAMLFREAIAAAPAPPATTVGLQVFASDVDPQIVATGREGRYPASIRDDVSPERLARFFTRDDQGYRVGAELRAAVVFTVQDVLGDPPFSRLDLVSCRNLLIYLDPHAQARVLARFHFALRTNGVLLLGSAETAGDTAGRFEAISRPARLYRTISRRGAGGPLDSESGVLRLPVRQGRGGAAPRQGVLAGLCARFVMSAHAPATIVSNARHEYLYSAGPTERYLRVAPGQPTQDLLAMVREDTRLRLRSAIGQAAQGSARVVVAGGRTARDGRAVPFRIEVQPVSHEGETLLLVCFVDEPDRAPGHDPPGPPGPPGPGLVAELERELEAARAELQGAARDREFSSQEQKAINEEALSVNEEVQSTNEELLTSKEELQSLNEELTALNSQLQATLEQQRTTSNDLQNVLYSTDVATLFLDTELRIRFFTPTTRSLFSIIPGDVGRPLSDLHSLAGDGALAADARAVLATHAPIEREIEAPGGTWFRRRILPYRTHDEGVEGVVITFNDITVRRHAGEALEAAREQAELASTAKSRFLAAASHDLRQPLQTMSLLQGVLAGMVGGEAKGLVARLDDSLGAMSGMLDTLLDINQIEAGIVRPEFSVFPLDALLERLRRGFVPQAQAQSLSLRVVACSLSVRSDPRLLEQMLRNLLSNALKYTRRGRVLLGCRRRGGVLSVEVWDTGVGIAEDELRAIFNEYHQVDNAARERSRGLGLGLSIVQRLGGLLGHPVRVRSRQGRGSVFAIDVALPPHDAAPPGPAAAGDAAAPLAVHASTVLVVEDDPEVRDLLELCLARQGHRALVAADGAVALALVAGGAPRPDLLLADYNLPGMDGLRLVATLRATLGANPAVASGATPGAARATTPGATSRASLAARLPAIILTGDISTATLRAIADQDCLRLTKPVRIAELAQAIQDLLSAPPAHPVAARPPLARPGAAAGRLASCVVHVVDDDVAVRQAIRAVLEADGAVVEDFADGESFLQAYRPHDAAAGCLLVDAYMPGMGGLELLGRIRDLDGGLAAILITGNGDVPMAVQAMRAGALDFIEKPIDAPDLLARIRRAIDHSHDAGTLSEWRDDAARRIAGLTPRQREVMDLVLAGYPSKNIAADLAISQRTVENHRASIMRKTGARSLPALARLALVSGGGPAAPEQPAPDRPAPDRPAARDA